MIRREESDDQGRRCWVLVEQREHAVLACKLAELWTDGALLQGPHRDELLEAVRKHDDGWVDRDTAPTWDPVEGRPLDFTEWPLAVSADVWDASTLAAEESGPLAAYMVSRHFSHLLLQRPFLEDESRRRCRFVTSHGWRQQAWLQHWLSGGPRRDFELAQQAVRWLQWFDWMSLWLCVRPRPEPYRGVSPSGRPMTWTQHDPWSVTLDPWPFAVDLFRVGATGRLIDAEAVSVAEAPAAIESRSGTLTWEFRRR